MGDSGGVPKAVADLLGRISKDKVTPPVAPAAATVATLQSLVNAVAAPPPPPPPPPPTQQHLESLNIGNRNSSNASLQSVDGSGQNNDSVVGYLTKLMLEKSAQPVSTASVNQGVRQMTSSLSSSSANDALAVLGRRSSTDAVATLPNQPNQPTTVSDLVRGGSAQSNNALIAVLTKASSSSSNTAPQNKVASKLMDSLQAMATGNIKGTTSTLESGKDVLNKVLQKPLSSGISEVKSGSLELGESSGSKATLLPGEVNIARDALAKVFAGAEKNLSGEEIGRTSSKTEAPGGFSVDRSISEGIDSKDTTQGTLAKLLAENDQKDSQIQMNKMSETSPDSTKNTTSDKGLDSKLESILQDARVQAEENDIKLESLLQSARAKADKGERDIATTDSDLATQRTGDKIIDFSASHRSANAITSSDALPPMEKGKEEINGLKGTSSEKAPQEHLENTFVARISDEQASNHGESKKSEEKEGDTEMKDLSAAEPIKEEVKHSSELIEKEVKLDKETVENKTEQVIPEDQNSKDIDMNEVKSDKKESEAAEAPADEDMQHHQKQDNSVPENTESDRLNVEQHAEDNADNAPGRDHIPKTYSIKDSSTEDTFIAPTQKDEEKNDGTEKDTPGKEELSKEEKEQRRLEQLHQEEISEEKQSDSEKGAQEQKLLLKELNRKKEEQWKREVLLDENESNWTIESLKAKIDFATWVSGNVKGWFNHKRLLRLRAVEECEVAARATLDGEGTFEEKQRLYKDKLNKVCAQDRAMYYALTGRKRKMCRLLQQEQVELPMKRHNSLLQVTGGINYIQDEVLQELKRKITTPEQMQDLLTGARKLEDFPDPKNLEEQHEQTIEQQRMEQAKIIAQLQRDLPDITTQIDLRTMEQCVSTEENLVKQINNAAVTLRQLSTFLQQGKGSPEIRQKTFEQHENTRHLQLQLVAHLQQLHAHMKTLLK